MSEQAVSMASSLNDCSASVVEDHYCIREYKLHHDEKNVQFVKENNNVHKAEIEYWRTIKQCLEQADSKIPDVGQAGRDAFLSVHPQISCCTSQYSRLATVRRRGNRIFLGSKSEIKTMVWKRLHEKRSIDAIINVTQRDTCRHLDISVGVNDGC